MASSGMNVPSPSIAVIGCGRLLRTTAFERRLTYAGSLGTAIVRGLMNEQKAKVRPSKICAAVSSQSSANTLHDTFEDSPIEVLVYQGGNTNAARDCDVSILACPPHSMSNVLGEKGMPDALKGKILISVLAGVQTSSILKTIYPAGVPSDDERCWVFRALPNLAVSTGASATAVEVPASETPAAKIGLVDLIMQQLGGIVHVPALLMDAGTVLCGSAPAWVALFVDGLVDGAVAAGVPRTKANTMAAQMLASTAALLKEDQRPSALRESICAMPGCTTQGNLILEEGGVRGVSAKAMKTAIEAASGLG